MEKIDLSIGNIFYILVTLVVVILGLAGKRKRPSSISSENDRAPGFMQNLENILKMGQEEPLVNRLEEQEVDPPVAEEYKAGLSPEEPLLEYASEKPDFMQENENIHPSSERFDSNRIAEVKEEDMGKLEVIDLDAKEGTDYFDIVRHFDAETAIIYAAIINRIDY